MTGPCPRARSRYNSFPVLPPCLSSSTAFLRADSFDELHGCTMFFLKKLWQAVTILLFTEFADFGVDELDEIFALHDDRFGGESAIKG